MIRCRFLVCMRWCKWKKEEKKECWKMWRSQCWTYDGVIKIFTIARGICIVSVWYYNMKSNVHNYIKIMMHKTTSVGGAVFFLLANIKQGGCFWSRTWTLKKYFKMLENAFFCFITERSKKYMKGIYWPSISRVVISFAWTLNTLDNAHKVFHPFYFFSLNE